MLFEEGFTFRNFLVDAFAIFMFVVWFWLLVIVFTDLFRRHDLSGLAKVLWVILLVAVEQWWSNGELISRLRQPIDPLSFAIKFHWSPGRTANHGSSPVGDFSFARWVATYAADDAEVERALDQNRYGDWLIVDRRHWRPHWAWARALAD
jgi:hypothetical protein